MFLLPPQTGTALGSRICFSSIPDKFRIGCPEVTIMRFFTPAFRRRLKAGLLAAGTLWAVAVTAGSSTASAAAAALQNALPLSLLRWELGDLHEEDTLSPAAVMALGESPLLLAARPEVARLQAQTPAAPSLPEAEEERITVPVEETPLDPPTAVNNGIPAKTLVPTDPNGYLVCGRTFISNSTAHTLTLEALQQPFAARLTDEEPQVLILHTHGSEAYTPADDSGIVWSGNHRTTDYRYNVVLVGDKIAETLGRAGISVLHDRTLYDYPSYSEAYDRALTAIGTHLEQYPSIRFVLDIHRDAVEDGQGNQYKVVSSVGREETAAQLSLVVGSDGSGLIHPDWMENLRLAVALQESLLADYPTLMRPLLLRNSRYNQHATTGSLLVEVGAAGNSPEEAVLSGQLFAEHFAKLLLNKKSAR